VVVLRIREPNRPRPFKVPFVWFVAPLGAAACVLVMTWLPRSAWERFAIWLAIGLVLYFVYGFRHSTLRRGAPPVPVTPPPPIEKT
jgi:APA family basic amino acid/polyamine antiporter